ncbi:hypothetical protein P2G88_01335 [Aliiglaciecola sp. CAU 1673]|uniref:hypothetical protein n=1 Tax=Aliiglaciecola sp. CAU 1673 TaxID=3032595 RepID=UPI0023DACD75|nr:hypothetical protein [Aliiglaciecola sp. CAU 1673]MDF2176894.1 hypothetical protein [Aliiglaciecola sp. CAU 1673]
MNKVALLACLMFSPLVAHANPKAFGFTLEQSTYDDFYARHGVGASEEDPASAWKEVQVDVMEVNFDGLTAISFVFDPNGLLVAINARTLSFVYNDIEASLARKYKPVALNDTDGNARKAAYREGNTLITLELPENAQQATLRYESDAYLKQLKTMAAHALPKKSN